MSAVDLWIDQGTSWGIAFPILDMNGDPVNLADWTARAQVRARAGSSSTLFEWSTPDGSGPGRITLENGVLTLLVSPAQSSGWSWRQGVYDIELRSPGGEVARPISGRVYVSAEVTR